MVRTSAVLTCPGSVLEMQTYWSECHFIKISRGLMFDLRHCACSSSSGFSLEGGLGEERATGFRGKGWLVGRVLAERQHTGQVRRRERRLQEPGLCWQGCSAFCPPLGHSRAPGGVRDASQVQRQFQYQPGGINAFFRYTNLPLFISMRLWINNHPSVLTRPRGND